MRGVAAPVLIPVAVACVAVAVGAMESRSSTRCDPLDSVLRSWTGKWVFEGAAGAEVDEVQEWSVASYEPEVRSAPWQRIAVLRWLSPVDGSAPRHVFARVSPSGGRPSPKGDVVGFVHGDDLERPGEATFFAASDTLARAGRKTWQYADRQQSVVCERIPIRRVAALVAPLATAAPTDRFGWYGPAVAVDEGRRWRLHFTPGPIRPTLTLFSNARPTRVMAEAEGRDDATVVEFDEQLPQSPEGPSGQRLVTTLEFGFGGVPAAGGMAIPARGMMPDAYVATRARRVVAPGSAPAGDRGR